MNETEQVGYYICYKKKIIGPWAYNKTAKIHQVYLRMVTS